MGKEVNYSFDVSMCCFPTQRKPSVGLYRNTTAIVQQLQDYLI